MCSRCTLSEVLVVKIWYAEISADRRDYQTYERARQPANLFDVICTSDRSLVDKRPVREVIPI